MSDVLQVQGINSKGFGIIPKLVMQDKRLTVEAKAIYGYFCSYAGAGRTAFPSRDKIVSDLGMSINRYYKHFNILLRFKYISVERETPVKGKLQRNLYTLLENIPCIQNGYMEKPCIQNAHMQNAYMQNEYTNNNSFKSNSLNNNSESEKPRAPTKNRYGEFQKIALTEDEHRSLVGQFGGDKINDYINRLDNHIASTGKAYTSHYATIKKWISEDARKEKQKSSGGYKNRFINFEQRQWDFDQIEQKAQQMLDKDFNDNRQ